VGNESAVVTSIRAMTAADWPRVRDIYRAGIATGEATFEVEAPATWEQFTATRLPDHRFVARVGPDAAPVGWATVSPVSHRPAYAGVVEDSVYVDPAATGAGIGRALLDSLIGSTEAAGIWTIQCGVFPENTASVALHERAGFRVVGVRRRVGRHRGRWRDVLLLERRSSVVE